MYIKRIILKNIRGFKELDFDLTRGDGSYAGWTVFTGDNGSGKSALLKAIAVGLVGKETARALQPSFQGWIREGEKDALIQIELVEGSDEEDFSIPLVAGEIRPLQTQLKIELKKLGREIKLQDAGENYHPQEFPEIRGFEGIKGYWPLWFICGYGPFRRVFGASFDAAQRMSATNIENFITLFDESASLAEVDKWLRNLHHKSLERNDKAYQNLQLLLEILRDELLPNQITVDRVDSDGLWLKDGNGVELAWSDMSDGYRTALALLADILRHMISQYQNLWPYPLRPENGPDGKPFIERSGVVLIDEIDAHLHPEWQQKIGFWLKRHFPNIQFLVTTHSPIICQAADDNGLFVLPEPGSQDKPKALSKEEYSRVIASRPDTILLTSAFGLQNTRSPRAVEGRAEFAKLKSKSRAGAQLSPEEDARMGELKIFGENEEEL